MKDLKVFSSEEFGKVRVLEINNEPWLVGKDVASKLGYKDTSDALKKHIDDDEKMTRQIADSLGRLQNTIVINESGLYSLSLSSKLPSAKKFKKWVTSEVLPTIRHHGAYMTPEKIEEALLNPDTIIQLATKLKEEQQARSEAEKQIQIMKPKAEFYDDVTESNHTLEMSLVAKTLNFKGVGRNKLFEILRSEGVLQRDNIPYQKYVDSGWFKTVETKFSKPTGDVGINIKTVVYQKGIAKISNTLKRLGYIQVKQNNI